jgi:hypothetical protein
LRAGAQRLGDVVEPFQQGGALAGVEREGMRAPSGAITTWRTRSTVVRALPGLARVCAAMARTASRGRRTGKRPFCRALPKKMSPKEGATTARTPMPISAHTAPSREEPQPKFSSASRMGEPRQGGWLGTKSGFSLPSGR